jgi:hypothetical protein
MGLYPVSAFSSHWKLKYIPPWESFDTINLWFEKFFIITGWPQSSQWDDKEMRKPIDMVYFNQYNS